MGLKVSYRMLSDAIVLLELTEEIFGSSTKPLGKNKKYICIDLEKVFKNSFGRIFLDDFIRVGTLKRQP